METATIIMNALVAGAAAGPESPKYPPVRDAYAALKNLIQRRYQSVSVDDLERKPGSRARQEAVVQTLAASGVDHDHEILDHARALLAAVDQRTPQNRDMRFGDTYVGGSERPPVFAGYPSAIPPLRPTFSGRYTEMAACVGALTKSAVPHLALVGLAGVGKTALATALAHHRQMLAHFRDGVLWAALGPQGDAMAALAAWGRALGQDISALPDLAARRQAVERLIGQRALLLVIDDACDAGTAEALRCGGPYCGHVLTTADKAVARSFAAGGQMNEILPLLREAAGELLGRLAPAACSADKAAAAALAAGVAGMPLSLTLLGGFLRTPEHHLYRGAEGGALPASADPARRLQLARERLAGLEGEAVTQRATIALSLAALPPEAERAFYALGAFAPEPHRFSLEAAAAVAEVDSSIISLLAARELIGIEESGPAPSLALHRSLAEVARSDCDAGAIVRHRQHYLAVAKEDGENYPAIDAAYGQIQAAWQAAPDGASLLQWVQALHGYQHARGYWRDLAAWQERALAVARVQTGRDFEGAVLANLGAVSSTLGERDKARAFYEQALPAYADSGDKAGLAAALNNLGAISDAAGNREQALEYFQRALPLCEQLGDRARLATTLNNLGAACEALGQRVKAQDYFQQALALRVEVGDRAGLAVTLCNLGAVHSALGERARALDYYEQALPVCDEVGDRASAAAVLNSLGSLNDAMGQRDKALDYHQQALRIRGEMGDRAGLATTLNNLGAVYEALGQHDRALGYFQQALPIRSELGDRAGLAITRYNIAMVHRTQGRLTEAVAELKQAVELDRGAQHPELDSYMAILAMVEAESAKQPEKQDWLARLFARKRK